LAAEIIDEFGDDLESVTLQRSDAGRFEVDVDGRSVFSKLASGQHANPGEVIANISQLSTADGYSEELGQRVANDRR
jgi:selenoprotein W-related protein